MMGGSMGLIALVGGILIAAVLAWAVIANRRRSGAQRNQTEAATRDLYRKVDRQDQATDPDREPF